MEKTIKEKTDAMAKLKQKILKLENTILRLENRVLKSEQQILKLKAENEKLKSIETPGIEEILSQIELKRQQAK